MCSSEWRSTMLSRFETELEPGTLIEAGGDGDGGG
jgi:hypothetical protein